MDIRSEIQSKRAAERSTLISRFSNADEVILKGMTQEQFNEKYSVGYDIFDQGSIEKFKADALEKGEDTAMILSEIESLKRVEVIKGDETVVLFVRDADEFAIEDEDEDLN
jgi:hypothetical protein